MDNQSPSILQAVKWPKPVKTADTGFFNSVVFLYTDRKKHKQALSYLGEETTIPSVGMAQSFQHKETGEHIVVIGWFDNDLLTLIHEISHTTFYVLDAAGVITTANNNETYCYLHEYIFSKLWTDPNSKTKTAKTSPSDSSKSGPDPMLNLSPSTLFL